MGTLSDATILTRLRRTLEQVRVVPALTGLLGPGDEIYLVGGAVRDLLLWRPLHDFDFATPTDPTSLAQAFAERIGGHWFFLDAMRRQSRVVVRSVTYDFAPYRAADLAGDLRLRDFTVNALAVHLGPAGIAAGLCDPLGGREDIRARLLRACSAGVFTDDPLRVLKGVRHAAVLGFTPEAPTCRLMRAAASLLHRVAGERVRAELVAIFAAPGVAESINLLEDFGFWRTFFGAPGGSFAAAAASVERLQAFLAVCSDPPEIASLCAEEHEAGFSRATLLKLATFLYGYKPAHLADTLGALRFGRRAAAILCALQALAPVRLAEAARLPDYERARALWAAQLAGSPVDALLFLPGLDGRPNEVWRTLLPILHAWRRHAVAGRIPDLVDGDRLRRDFGLREGKELGRLLTALRQEEIAGRVRSIEQAAGFLRAQRREND